MDDTSEAAMIAVLSMAMALQHAKVLDAEAYVVRLTLNSLLARQNGRAGEADALDTHIAAVRATLVQRGSTQ